ncbi:AsnC family protein [Streptomyces sp. HC44]|uniref:AsnC family protein n=1 Tax=Streptomyces scabichelini TaxID=2711217 RepID=A0A6G4V368_9ACTN|nr:AsnC family protein [Streptomyces scabichelini]
MLRALQLDGRAPFSRIAAVLGVSDRAFSLARARPRKWAPVRRERLHGSFICRVVGAS